MNKDLTGLTRDYVSRPKSQYFSEIVRWGGGGVRWFVEKKTHTQQMLTGEFVALITNNSSICSHVCYENADWSF